VKDILGERKPATVVEISKQVGDAQIRDKWKWAEPSIWTERMLTALEEGVKGGKWFALMDKVYDHYKWPNAYFSRLGLFTLTAAHEQARQFR
jgi:hypothetical protein